MDKRIICKDCGGEFIFPERDQKFFRDKGWGEPIRCKECRIKRKINAPKRENTY